MAGAALKMRLELARCGLTPLASEVVPLLPPQPGPMIYEGVACPVTIDREHTRFRPWSIALPWMLKRPLPPLLWRHREPAGRIERLWHDPNGELAIRAYVEHPLALRASHFSICATIRNYRMHDGFAEVTDAEAVEVSITDRPCNSDAVVLHRHPAVDYYGDAIARVKRVADLVRELHQ